MTPDGPLRALDADARRRAGAPGAPRPSPRRSRSCCCTPTAIPSTSWRSARRWREALPDVHVSLSHEVVGTFREYERAATTEVDAALSPLLGRLPAPPRRPRCGEAGIPEPTIMQSNGGLIDVEAAAGHAAWTVLSGPAGGAAGAAFVARAAGAPGRAVLRHGRHLVRRVRRRRRRGAGAQLAARSPAGRWRCRCSRSTPSAPAAARSPGATAGARCGSDRGRRAPSPGRPATAAAASEPTVTDANLLLGYLASDAPLAGGVDLDRERRRARDRPPRRGARARTARVRRGDHPRRQRRDGPGAAGRHRGARDRPAPLRAAGLRRRRPAARRGDRRGARDHDDRLPARLGRPRRARPGRLAPRAATCSAACLLSGDSLSAEAIAERGRARRAGPRGARRARAPSCAPRTSCATAARRSSWPSPAGSTPEPGRAAPRPSRRVHEERYGYSDPEQTLELVTIRVTATDPGRRSVSLTEGRGRGTGAAGARTAVIGRRGDRARGAARHAGARRPRSPARRSSSCPSRRCSSRPAGRGEVDAGGTIHLERRHDATRSSSRSSPARCARSARRWARC